MSEKYLVAFTALASVGAITAFNAQTRLRRGEKLEYVWLILAWGMIAISLWTHPLTWTYFWEAGAFFGAGYCLALFGEQRGPAHW
jgi:hypothetical protein